MNEFLTISATTMSFKEFIFKDKRNRIMLLLAAVAIVVQFSIFKYFYPHPNFIHGDSFSYIRAADENLSISTYLVGYSSFLRLFSVFTKSDILLTAFQYFLIQAGGLFLLFTIFYFYKTGKLLQWILLAFMVLNPLFLHLGNLISSDGYFLSLSLLWIASLIWIMQQPTKFIILWHILSLFLAFTTRYNGMLYPFISAAVFIWISRLTIREKIIGIGSGTLLCLSFIIFTSYQYKKMTGHWQYSPFSGWQLANNAMYAYRFVDSVDRKPVSNKFYALDRMIREYFDSTKDTKRFVTEKLMASTFYMWSPGMPLWKYQDNLFKKDKDTTLIRLKKWASMGPLYKEYGIYIIKQYPWHFTRYFIWPNAGKYYAPPIEFLESYNSGKDFVPIDAQNWFNYKTNKLKTRFDDKETWILNFFPILSGMINVVMLCSIISFLLLKGYQYDSATNKLFLLGLIIWLLNAAFTIVASSAALRFQAFPITLTTIMDAVFINWMVKIIEIFKKESGKLKGQRAAEEIIPGIIAQ